MIVISKCLKCKNAMKKDIQLDENIEYITGTTIHKAVDSKCEHCGQGHIIAIKMPVVISRYRYDKNNQILLDNYATARSDQ